VRLQLRDLAGDCGRRYRQAIGGSGEAAQLDHPCERTKGLEAVHLQTLLLFTQLSINWMAIYPLNQAIDHLLQPEMTLRATATVTA